MNYLSHFYIDAVEGDPYFNAGLLLPDVAKRQVPRFTLASDEPESIRLLDGCHAHYRADKLFHASPFFESLLARVTPMVNKTPFSSRVNRKWFIAHVMAELMIDRVIVITNKACTDRFYASLDAVDRVKLIRFLELNQATDIPTFMKGFEHFCTARFIYYYADTKKLVYSLNRIMQRIGLPELHEADQSAMEQLCFEVERMYFSDREALLSQLRSIFG